MQCNVVTVLYVADNNRYSTKGKFSQNSRRWLVSAETLAKVRGMELSRTLLQQPSGVEKVKKLVLMFSFLIWRLSTFHALRDGGKVGLVF